jgi:hypothetical protein
VNYNARPIGTIAVNRPRRTFKIRNPKHVKRNKFGFEISCFELPSQIPPKFQGMFTWNRRGTNCRDCPNSAIVNVGVNAAACQTGETGRLVGMFDEDDGSAGEIHCPLVRVVPISSVMPFMPIHDTAGSAG